MASDAESVGGLSDEQAAKRTRRKAAGATVDLQDLEKRVRIAELRAREVEAEVRYMEASAKRRDMKSDKRGKGTKEKGKKRNRSKDTDE